MVKIDKSDGLGIKSASKPLAAGFPWTVWASLKRMSVQCYWRCVSAMITRRPR